jgi:hypothetical protein
VKPARAIIVQLVWSIALVAACGGKKAAPVADLLEGQGAVEREHGRAKAAAPNGQPFVLGDAAHTGAGAWARLKLRGGTVLRLGADTRVRFLTAGARLERGDAIAEDAPITILTEAGTAIIERGGVLRATERDGATRVEVVVGRAQLSGLDGDVTLEAGGGIVVAVGGAILERIGAPPRDAGPGGAGDRDAGPGGVEAVLDAGVADDGGDGDGDGDGDGGGDAGLDDATAATSVPAPASIDVALGAGERAVIHDPTGEVGVRVGIGDACAGAAGAIVELADARGSFVRARRTSGGAFVARAGTTRFRVRCPDGRTGRAGALRVARDSGAAAVVRTAPRNVIEADGRRYDITYQNRMPDLDVTWSEATGTTTLHLLGPDGSERTATATGAHRLASGTLDDGRYRLWLTAGARSSPRSTLTIAFDNALPAAQIIAPPPRAAWSDPLTVRGVTVEGWTVAVDGRPAARDGGGRFHADVAVGDRRVIAIRLAHPLHGVHYYLRRRE